MKIMIAIMLVVLVGCTAVVKKTEPVIAGNFALVKVRDNYASSLVDWMHDNPNKRVVSFSGILSYQEGCSGFVVHFAEGQNRQQRFEKVDAHSIYGLQEWCASRPEVKIVAVSTVPSYSGGIREFIVCFEENR